MIVLMITVVLFNIECRTFGEISRFCCSIWLNDGNVKIGLWVVPVQLKIQLVLAKEGTHLDHICINIVSTLFSHVRLRVWVNMSVNIIIVITSDCVSWLK